VIEYDDFAKLEFRVGKILAADEVPKSDRLFRLDVDVGTEKRQVLAGIRGSYTAAELIGREVVVLVNLKPRKMMGTESQGMVLAAEVGGRSVLLALEKPVGPGAGIK
jgi:methionyl-tRNA synthetase